jgi:hypothetical protein
LKWDQLYFPFTGDAGHFRQHRSRVRHMLEEPLTAARIKRIRLEGKSRGIRLEMVTPGTPSCLLCSALGFCNHGRIMIHPNHLPALANDLRHRKCVSSWAAPHIEHRLAWLEMHPGGGPLFVLLEQVC